MKDGKSVPSAYLLTRGSNRDGKAFATEPPTERAEGPGSPSWHRHVSSGTLLVVGFFGIINLASVAAKHGFEWHAAIKGIVEEYRTTIYPIYNSFLVPALAHFKIHVPNWSDDIITLTFLSFAAANAEASIRHKRPLIMLYVRLFGKISAVIFSSFSRRNRQKDPEYLGDKYFEDADNFLTRFELVGPRMVIFFIIAFFANITGLSILLFRFVWDENHGHHALPRWLDLWAATWWIWFIISLVNLAIVVVQYFLKENKRAYLVLEWLGRPMRLAINLGIFPWSGGAMLVVLASLVGSVLEFFGCIILVSPILAWRTASVTATAFGLVMAVNWLALNWLR